MKKGGFLRNVLDTIRSNQSSSQSSRGNNVEKGLEFGNLLKQSHFSLAQVARHGFPENPTALAFDPVQKIAAIGTKSGAIRVFGRPGVDVWAQHEPAFPVTQIKFIINQGALITVTADDSIHLWSLRGPNLRLIFPSGPSSSANCSPAPTPASNISSISPQSGSSSATGAGVSQTPSSFLGQITDTVTGAVDSASDFLSGGVAAASPSDYHHHQPPLTPSPTCTSSDKGFKQPELLHTLKFQREHITYIHQTLSSKWLYIGTGRGNVHVANVETFELSGYSIAWNKAIELSRKTHPGSIIHLSECPQDTNKLLIGYESGCIVIWDLKQRNADGRYYHTENLLWLAWHHEGKQFLAAHGDGSLITWQTRSNTKPSSILFPHAKTASSGSSSVTTGQQQQQPALGQQQQQQQHQQHSLASSIARSLNNELYRPINKVEWRTSKGTNESFILFSGGLPYDTQEQIGSPSHYHQQTTSIADQQEARTLALRSPNAPSPSWSSLVTPSASQQQQQQTQQQQQQQSLRSSPIVMSPSPNSLSVSPKPPEQSSKVIPQKSKKHLRSTSLTVMHGKSITVLEMDDIVVDFILISDNSPYENDASDPYAVIVLLSNELILIDLTSSGYPSFDSPYPSTSLVESPVTCVQYLADCTTDLIPFLYSTSQYTVSRSTKKGFSDKEWPINGGEWGQSMQSYPELVVTGHADGTIKFWDMSGINFDLVSKIKTAKLFERPKKLPNAIVFVAAQQHQQATSTSNGSSQNLLKRQATSSSGPMTSTSTTTNSATQFRPISPYKPMPHNEEVSNQSSSSPSSCIPQAADQSDFDDSLFAIEKIEFCSITKRLFVAGALSQVIQFRLNKKDSQQHQAAANTNSELTTIFVEPPTAALTSASASANVMTNANLPMDPIMQQSQNNNSCQFKLHHLLRLRDIQSATGSSSGGSSSSTSSHNKRGLNGFQAELICLSPLLLTTVPPEDPYEITGFIPASSSSSSSSTSTTTSPPTLLSPFYTQMPPKVSSIAFQAQHNM